MTAAETYGPDDGAVAEATAALRRQIEDLEASLAAIAGGGVDAVLFGPPDDQQLYTLVSADRPYRVIVEEMGEGAATISASGRVLYANRRLSALLGWDRDALLGSTMRDLVSLEDHAIVDEFLAVPPGETARAECTFLRPDGSAVATLASVTGLDIEGVVVRCLLVADLTERLAVEERERQRALTESSAQFVAAFERAPVGMALVSWDRTILRANEALGALTGQSVTELAGLPLAALTEDPSPDLELFAALAAGHTERYHSEVRVRRADAALRWASLSVSRVGDGDASYAAFHIEDISDRKSYEDQLQHLADHDPLTGLLNRRRFHEMLDHALALGRRHHVDRAVALLDLDNFKYINDTLGHQTGDVLLCAVTAALSSRLRDSDVLARLGGDEFAVLLYAVDADMTEAVVRDLLTAVREQGVTSGGQRARTTASAGVVRLDQSAGSTADEVLANADLAMYTAKEGGGDDLLLYDASGPAAALSRAKFVWIDRVRQALEEDRFTLLAQPILDLAQEEVRGAELLLRMQDGDSLVEPEQFLGIAERHGLASAVDAHVVRNAIALAARLGTGPGFRWEINISGGSLDDPSLVGVIETQLELHNVPPASLVFEITETAAIKNMSQAQAFATRVTDLGCGFALDDFGAGYGGFYYLKYLPLDYLKIDGEFIRKLLADRTNQVIVQAMVALARPLGKQTIAEYVLDEDTLDLLRELHVDHAQGYHIGMPIPPGQLFPLGAPPPRRSGSDGTGRRVLDLTSAPGVDSTGQRGG